MDRAEVGGQRFRLLDAKVVKRGVGWSVDGVESDRKAVSDEHQFHKPILGVGGLAVG
jgi:hypothetical protein